MKVIAQVGIERLKVENDGAVIDSLLLMGSVKVQNYPTLMQSREISYIS